MSRSTFVGKHAQEMELRAQASCTLRCIHENCYVHNLLVSSSSVIAPPFIVGAALLMYAEVCSRNHAGSHARFPPSPRITTALAASSCAAADDEDGRERHLLTSVVCWGANCALTAPLLIEVDTGWRWRSARSLCRDRGRDRERKMSAVRTRGAKS